MNCGPSSAQHLPEDPRPLSRMRAPVRRPALLSGIPCGAVSAPAVRERDPEVVKAEGEGVLFRLPHGRLGRLGDGLVGGQRGRRPAPGCRSCLVIALAHWISRRCDHYADQRPILCRACRTAAGAPSTTCRPCGRCWTSPGSSAGTGAPAWRRKLAAVAVVPPLGRRTRAPDVRRGGRDRLKAEAQQDGLAVVRGVHLQVADAAGNSQLGTSSDQRAVDTAASPGRQG